MDPVSIFGLLGIALSVWKDERRDRFEKKRLTLLQDYYDELKRPEDDRSQLALDNIMLELENIARTVLASTGNSSHKA